jgi:hypothetical protein
MAPDDRPVVRDSNETLWQLAAHHGTLLTSVDLSPDFKVRLSGEPALRSLASDGSGRATLDPQSRYAFLTVQVDSPSTPANHQGVTKKASVQHASTQTTPASSKRPEARAPLQDVELNILRHELRREEVRLASMAALNKANENIVTTYASREIARYRNKKVWVL